MEYGKRIFDYITWNLICSKLAEKSGLYHIRIAPRSFGKTMTSRALFASIINNFHDDFDKNTISLRWCEYFIIPKFRKMKNYIVPMPKIERYVIMK